MTNPQVIVTLILPRPFMGSQVISAVKAFIDENGTYGSSFIHEQGIDTNNADVFVIGQHSRYPYNQILVAPTRDSHDIRPDHSYTKIEVMSTRWRAATFRIGYEDNSVRDAVYDFAEKLKEYFSDMADTDMLRAWPQDVEVCAFCEKILRRRSPRDVYCASDGDNPPIKTMKVMPVTK